MVMDPGLALLQIQAAKAAALQSQGNALTQSTQNTFNTVGGIADKLGQGYYNHDVTQQTALADQTFNMQQNLAKVAAKYGPDHAAALGAAGYIPSDHVLTSEELATVPAPKAAPAAAVKPAPMPVKNPLLDNANFANMPVPDSGSDVTRRGETTDPADAGTPGHYPGWAAHLGQVDGPPGVPPPPPSRVIGATPDAESAPPAMAPPPDVSAAAHEIPNLPPNPYTYQAALASFMDKAKAQGLGDVAPNLEGLFHSRWTSNLDASTKAELARQLQQSEIAKNSADAQKAMAEASMAGSGGFKGMEERAHDIAMGAMEPKAARLLQNTPIDDFDSIEAAQGQLKKIAEAAVTAQGGDPTNPSIQAGISKALAEQGAKYTKKATPESAKVNEQVSQGLSLVKQLDDLDDERKKSNWDPSAARIAQKYIDEIHIDPFGVDVTSFMKGIGDARARGDLTPAQYAYLQQAVSTGIELGSYKLQGRAIREFDWHVFQDMLNPYTTGPEWDAQVKSLKRGLGQQLKDQVDTNLSTGIPLGKRLVDGVHSIDVPEVSSFSGGEYDKKFKDTKGSADASAAFAQALTNAASTLEDIPENIPISQLAEHAPLIGHLITVAKAAGVPVPEKGSFKDLMDWATGMNELGKSQTPASPASPAAPQAVNPAASATAIKKKADFAMATSETPAPGTPKVNLSGVPRIDEATLVPYGGGKYAPPAAAALKDVVSDPDVPSDDKHRLFSPVSSFRSVDTQLDAQKRYDALVAKGLNPKDYGFAARPTTPKPTDKGHILGQAIDVGNHPLDEKTISALEAAGWVQTNPTNDPGHFEFRGA